MEIVCKNCFADKELKGFIVSQNKIGNCECCGRSDVEILKIDELFDFFKELFNNFQVHEKGERLISKIQGNWSLFSDLDIGKRILNHVFEKVESSLKSSEDLVDFHSDILENINHWDTLKEQLKWERRYLTDIAFLTDDLGWDSFFESKIRVKREDVFYRARLHKNVDENLFPKDQMFCPNKEIATAGRANPSGIPYLYLSDNSETTLYEIRASYLDEVSIATFNLNKALKQEIIISDFTEIPSLYSPNEVNKRIKSTLLKQLISKDLSKPMRRYDSDLDYIPTQFICEFIKVFTDVKGIKFRSSLHQIGNNLVIFDQNIMECIDVNKVQISEVAIDSKNI